VEKHVTGSGMMVKSALLPTLAYYTMNSKVVSWPMKPINSPIVKS